MKKPSPRKLKLMRFAATRASNKYSTGGRLKTQGNKPVTVPSLSSPRNPPSSKKDSISTE